MVPYVNGKLETLALLDQSHVEYERHDHAPAHTIEDCLAMPFINDSITICKNILLCNRQKTDHYLMLLKPSTPFRTAVVSKALGVSRLSFAPDDTLPKLLHLTAGSVCPFGLIFDTERSIHFAYERSVRDTPRIAFHPCDNATTLIFTQEAFWSQVVPLLGHEPIGLDAVV